MGSVHRLVTAGAPATSPREERAMVAPADQDAARLGLLLEVALQAKIGIPLCEQFVVHRPMRIVASGATFAHCLVLEHEGSALRNVALGAGVRIARHGEWTARRGLPLVRIVAIAAAHLAIADRMRVRQLKPPFHFKVAGEAHLRITIRVDDGVPRAARLRVQAPRTVAAFAADILRVRSFGHQSRVRRRREMLVQVGVTFGATFGTDELRSGNIRRHHHHAIDCDA